MNKKLLGLLMLPALALASCSGGFKKVKYLSVGGAELVAERGVAVTYEIIGTYKLNATDLAAIRAQFTNFPESFNISVESWVVDPNGAAVSTIDKVAPKTVNVGGMYTLDLTTSVTVKHYTEYTLKASERTIKETVHLNEGLPGELQVFANTGAIDVEQDPEVTEYPTDKYEVVGYETYRPETLERVYVVAQDTALVYAFE